MSDGKPGREATLEELARLLREVGVPERVAREVGWDTHFFDEGILDSVSLVALAMKVEKEFGLRVSAAEFDPPNFMTPRRIAELVARARRRE